MAERIVQGGCTAPTASRWTIGYISAALAYALAVGCAASLLSLLGAGLMAYFFFQGERGLELGIDWYFAQPVVALLSLASAAAFPYYRVTLSWSSSILFFLANTTIVAVLSLYLAHALPPEMLPWGWAT
jgi:hypothetical protein